VAKVSKFECQKFCEIQKTYFGVLMHCKNGAVHRLPFACAHNSLSLSLPLGCACNLLPPHLPGVQ
jgi:hypothetical protein